MTTTAEMSQYDIAIDMINFIFKSDDLDKIQNPRLHKEILDQIWFENAVKRHIRNKYGLWEDSCLTKGWRENPESRYVKNHIDYSEDHPDQMSDKIFKLIEQLLIERKTNAK